eukprot:gene5743-6691_t
MDEWQCPDCQTRNNGTDCCVKCGRDPYDSDSRAGSDTGASAAPAEPPTRLKRVTVSRCAETNEQGGHPLRVVRNSDHPDADALFLDGADAASAGTASADDFNTTLADLEARVAAHAAERAERRELTDAARARRRKWDASHVPPDPLVAVLAELDEDANAARAAAAKVRRTAHYPQVAKVIVERRGADGSADGNFAVGTPVWWKQSANLPPLPVTILGFGQRRQAVLDRLPRGPWYDVIGPCGQELVVRHGDCALVGREAWMRPIPCLRGQFRRVPLKLAAKGTPVLLIEQARDQPGYRAGAWLYLNLDVWLDDTNVRVRGADGQQQVPMCDVHIPGGPDVIDTFLRQPRGARGSPSYGLFGHKEPIQPITFDGTTELNRVPLNATDFEWNGFRFVRIYMSTITKVTGGTVAPAVISAALGRIRSWHRTGCALSLIWDAGLRRQVAVPPPVRLHASAEVLGGELDGEPWAAPYAVDVQRSIDAMPAQFRPPPQDPGALAGAGYKKTQCWGLIASYEPGMGGVLVPRVACFHRVQDRGARAQLRPSDQILHAMLAHARQWFALPGNVPSALSEWLTAQPVTSDAERDEVLRRAFR